MSCPSVNYGLKNYRTDWDVVFTDMICSFRERFMASFNFEILLLKVCWHRIFGILGTKIELSILIYGLSWWYGWSQINSIKTMQISCLFVRQRLFKVFQELPSITKITNSFANVLFWQQNTPTSMQSTVQFTNKLQVNLSDINWLTGVMDANEILNYPIEFLYSLDISGVPPSGYPSKSVHR